jgi:hypothetical protein
MLSIQIRHQRNSTMVLQAKDEPLLSARNLPPRSSMQQALKRATASEPLDVLVIGGGATGTGTALDATTRYIIVIYMYSRALGYT